MPVTNQIILITIQFSNCRSLRVNSYLYRYYLIVLNSVLKKRALLMGWPSRMVGPFP